MYIDTSCLVAYYLPEQKSSVVQENIHSADQVVISLLTDIEMLSAIRKKERMGNISAKDADEVFQLYKNHRENGLYKVVELTPPIFKASEFILQSTSNALRTLDALHLGIAQAKKFELFSFDQTLIDSARELNIKTIV